LALDIGLSAGTLGTGIPRGRCQTKVVAEGVDAGTGGVGA
jgi:hypothetical protein